MTSEGDLKGPPLQRDAYGQVDVDSVPDVIEWFLNYDQRVAIIRHPSVEEVFQWKQQHVQSQGEEIFQFNRAEDRLAIGIIQALADNSTERDLHDWIGQLLGALDAASKDNETTADAYKLDLKSGGSIVKEAEKIPEVPTASGLVEMALRPEDDHAWQFFLSPWPFRQTTLKLVCEGRLLDKKYKSNREMLMGLQNAEIVSLQFELTPG